MNQYNLHTIYAQSVTDQHTCLSLHVNPRVKRSTILVSPKIKLLNKEFSHTQIYVIMKGVQRKLCLAAFLNKN